MLHLLLVYECRSWLHVKFINKASFAFLKWMMTQRRISMNHCVISSKLRSVASSRSSMHHRICLNWAIALSHIKILEAHSFWISIPMKRWVQVTFCWCEKLSKLSWYFITSRKLRLDRSSFTTSTIQSETILIWKGWNCWSTWVLTLRFWGINIWSFFIDDWGWRKASDEGASF